MISVYRERETKENCTQQSYHFMFIFTKIYKSSTVITIYLQPIDPERVKEVVERERKKKNS